MISCGEASGDLYAAALVRALRSEVAQLSIFGFGGPKLAAEGAELASDYSRFAVTGLVEALSVVPRSLQMLWTLTDMARERRPDVFVAIDFPDFNFRLLPAMHRLGIPVVYYVSPQLWAWRPGRIRQIQRYVSKMLVIFPFEAAIYQQAKVPVAFVGHPLIDLLGTPPARSEWLTSIGVDPLRPVVALLPGSRPNEIGRILPVMADAVPLIEASVPGVQFVVARAPSLPDEVFAPLAALGGRVRVVTDAADAVLASADVVVTASGTATVQAALHGCPMVIVYRLSPLTYAIGRTFVKLKQYGMVNLIAGRVVAPELIQEGCTPEAIHTEAVRLLTDPVRSARMRADLAEVRTRLGGGGGPRRAAEAVLSVVAHPG